MGIDTNFLFKAHLKGVVEISNDVKIMFGLFLIICLLIAITISMIIYCETLKNGFDNLERKNKTVINENEFLKATLKSINTQKEVNYMYGVATAYTPSAGGINSDEDPTVTSTMKPAKNGVIAVNPNVIPYGSEVMIIHNNTIIRGQAQDTGGAMRQNPKQVDILMENYKEALNWGRKSVHIIWW